MSCTDHTISSLAPWRGCFAPWGFLLPTVRKLLILPFLPSRHLRRFPFCALWSPLPLCHYRVETGSVCISNKHGHDNGLQYTCDEYFASITSFQDIPEKRLLVAVLQRAIQDFTDPKSTDYKRQCARRWLWSDSRTTMSVRWICGMLSDDPEGLRSLVLGRVAVMTDKPKSVLIRVDTK